MRLPIVGLLTSVLITAGEAQSYYPPYANSAVTVVYPPPVSIPPPVIVTPRQTAYLIAFRDSAVGVADAYWVSGNTLHYVTPDHRMKMAPLATVDRIVSERLNREQNVPFSLPSQPGEAELRRLLEQRLNVILGTSETPRGLMVGISDVLFDFNQATLKPVAREKLAGIAGVLLDYDGLSLRLQGYTDDIGSAGHNLQLSRRRADAVRDYLLSQGVPAANLTAAGLGSASPVASNATAAGRQQNRRVEMLISGGAIGVTSASSPPD